MPPPHIPGLEGIDLTPREVEIIHLLLEQLSNLAIALKLECGVKNVEAHISNVFRKTHTSSRIELVMKIMNAKRETEGGAPTPP